MPRNNKTNATQAQTTAIVPRLRNCSERNGCDRAARAAGDFTGGRLTRETAVEDTGGAAARIFASPASTPVACAIGTESFAERSENSCERAEPACKAKLSLPVEVFRKSLKPF